MEIVFKIRNGIVWTPNPDEDFTEASEEALNISIKKWEFILDSVLSGKTIVDCGGYFTCALCRIYNNGGEGCDGCPVDKITQSSCNDSPLHKIYENPRKNGSFRIPLVRKELKFLKSLRDE